MVAGCPEKCRLYVQKSGQTPLSRRSPAFEDDRRRDAALLAAGRRTLRLTDRAMETGDLRRVPARAPP
jgi:hypothetical protein